MEDGRGGDPNRRWPDSDNPELAETQESEGCTSFHRNHRFYRRFVERYSHIAKPLTDLTRKWIPFHWRPREQAA